MRYSVSNWIYGDEDLPITAARLSRLGYDAIELTGEPSRYRTPEVKAVLGDHGLAVSSIAGMYPWPSDRDLANPDPAVRRAACDYVASCIEFANTLGAPVVIVVPTCVGRTRPLSDAASEWRWAVESVASLAPTAAKAEVILAVEPINRYESFLLNTAQQAVKFAAEVGSEYVRVMLDCFHMNIEEADPALAILRVGAALVNLHVADSNRMGVGRGHTDFQAIMRALVEIGYSYAVTLEPVVPTADPYAARSGARDQEFCEAYARESISLLKLFEAQAAQAAGGKAAGASSGAGARIAGARMAGPGAGAGSGAGR